MKCFSCVKRLSSHRYLVQLAGTCVIFLLLPCLLVIYSAIQQSIKALTDTTNQFYLHTTESFSSYFQKELNDMRTQALQISADSRNSKKEGSVLLQLVQQTNPYYYSEAISLLKGYGQSNPSFVGIYLENTDAFITKSYKYTADSYLSASLNITDSELQKKLMDFFASDDSPRFRFASTFGKGVDSQELLLIGIPAAVTALRSPALFVYAISVNSIDTSQFSSPGTYGAQYDIFSGGDPYLLFSTGCQDTAGLEEIGSLIDFERTRLEGSTIQEVSQNDLQYTLFAVWDTSLGCYCVVSAPYDQINQSAYDYYSVMKIILLITVGVLTILLAVLIYINYSPIQQIIRKVRPGNGGKNELLTISTAIDSMTNELNEQNMLIKDYLLSNILYGKPIHENDLHRLGINGYAGYYQVCAITDISLTTEERVGLTNIALQKFSIPIFITDIWQKNLAVIVCLLPDDEDQALLQYLDDWLKSRHPENHLYTGMVVNSANRIRESFLSCFDSQSAKEEAAAPAKKSASQQSDQLAQEILEYLKENFCSASISQTAVADHFNISTYSLSRLFKSQFGIGFTEYISTQRIEYAKQLLLTTDQPVSSVASTVGLPNVNYFSRLFKSCVGVPPLRYRNQFINE